MIANLRREEERRLEQERKEAECYVRRQAEDCGHVCSQKCAPDIRERVPLSSLQSTSVFCSLLAWRFIPVVGGCGLGSTLVGQDSRCLNIGSLRAMRQ